MKKDITACLSHNTDDWRTPSKLYQAFMNIGAIDVCPFQCDKDLYGIEYLNSIIYMNPPFSQLKKWLEYAIYLSKLNNEVYVLMPVRTDTKYFSSLYHSHTIESIYFMEGRLHFNDSDSAPFPSMIICLNGFRHLSDIKIDLCSMDEFIRRYL